MNFQSQLDAALKTPSGPVALNIAEKFMKLCRPSSSKVPWSEAQRSAKITTSLATHRLQGDASIFCSDPPDDVKHPVTVALCHPFVSRDSYPATDSEDFKTATANLRGATPQQRGVNKTLDMSEQRLQMLVAKHPVVATLGFDTTLNHVLEHATGGTPNSRSDMPLADTFMGIVGRVATTGGVIETDERRSLHFHAQHRGGDAAKLMSDVAHDDALCSRALAALDSMITCELALEEHAMDVALTAMHIGRRRGRAFDQDYAKANTSEFEAIASSVVRDKSSHRHMRTCTKSKLGQSGCRVCAPGPHDISATRMSQLEISAPSRRVQATHSHFQSLIVCSTPVTATTTTRLACVVVIIMPYLLKIYPSPKRMKLQLPRIIPGDTSPLSSGGT